MYQLIEKGDILTVDTTPLQLENVGISEYEIIGCKVKCLFKYSTGYIQVEWLSPNYGLIKYDIPHWFLKK